MSKTSLLLVFFSFFMLASNAQNLPKINNTITPQHQRVEGTKLYMIIPEGFEQAAEIIAFGQPGKDNSIIIREAAGSYKESIQQFMTENMAVKGLKIISQEKMKLNDDDATLIRLTQKVHRTTFSKYLLFFGDNDYNVMVSAVFGQDDATIESMMKKSLLSVAYADEDEELQMPKGFVLDFKSSELKFAHSINDAVIYSADGGTSKNSLTQNSFFAGSSMLSTKTKNDPSVIALDRIQKQSKLPIQITHNQLITIAGLQGIEIKADTKTADGVSRNLYQVLLFEGDFYYILYGSTAENQAAQMSVFEQLARSFKKK